MDTKEVAREAAKIVTAAFNVDELAARVSSDIAVKLEVKIGQIIQDALVNNELVRLKELCEKHEHLSQNQAYIHFGEGFVKDCVRRGLIQREADGVKTVRQRIRYRTSRLYELKKQHHQIHKYHK